MSKTVPLQEEVRFLTDAQFRLNTLVALFQSGRVTQQIEPEKFDEITAAMGTDMLGVAAAVETLCRTLQNLTSLSEINKLLAH